MCRRLDVLVAKRKLDAAQIEAGKELLSGIVQMLVALMKSLSERVYPNRAGKDGPAA
jgi:hypothetical protein